LTTSQPNRTPSAATRNATLTGDVSTGPEASLDALNAYGFSQPQGESSTRESRRSMAAATALHDGLWLLAAMLAVIGVALALIVVFYG
jgi:hypothetical protein